MKCRKTIEMSAQKMFVSLNSIDEIRLNTLYTMTVVEHDFFLENGIELTFFNPITMSLNIDADGILVNDVQYAPHFEGTVSNIKRLEASQGYVNLYDENDNQIVSTDQTYKFEFEPVDIILEEFIYDEYSGSLFYLNLGHFENVLGDRQQIVWYGSAGKQVNDRTVSKTLESLPMFKLTDVGAEQHVKKAKVYAANIYESFTLTFPRTIRIFEVCVYGLKNDTLIQVARSTLRVVNSITFTIPTDITSVLIDFEFTDNASYYITENELRVSKIAYTNFIKIPAENFAEKQEGVACSLNQQLSLIQGELWYNITEGIPLFEEGVSVTTIDARIIQIVMRHPDVISITSFNSRYENHKYSADVVAMTKYGEVSLSV